MGNITGNPFDEGVVAQIDARQTSLGLNPKPDSTLVYQNNKNAFLRLASSINIQDNTEKDVTAKQILELRDLPESLKGNGLAKKCVLFGGVTSIDGNNFTKPSGLASLGDVFSGAYGWGGIGSRGYVPMPGIESANISFYNRGALARAELKIKVYSVEQLQIFDLLYFRIGYTMLLEWGHVLYLNNEGTLVNRNDFFTDPFSKFFETKKQDDILKAIKKERKDSFYNYDAMLGKVVNFTWKFNTDGSYDIDLKLIGYGDLIEALKINTTGEAPTAKPPTQSDVIKQTDQKAQAADQAALNAANAAAEKERQAREAREKAQTDLATKKSQFIVEYDNIILQIDNTDTRPSFTFSTSTITSSEIFPDDVNGLGNAYDAINADIASLQRFTGKNGELEIKALLNKLKDIISNWGNALGESSQAEQNASNLEKEAEDKKAEENRRRQEAERLRRNSQKAAEEYNLSPPAAQENQNSTRLNEELYKWREEAKKANTVNFCSLPFTSKSASLANTTLQIHQYYVRLGYIFEWIQRNLLIYDNTKPGDDGSDVNPLFTIDFDPDTNYCMRFPYQISADPLTCIIPSKNLVDGKGWEYFTKANGNFPDLSNYFVEGNDNLGKVMNIMVNIDFVARVLARKVDANGKTNFLSFFKDILNSINDALGNVNKLDIVYDSEENQVKIIEGSRLQIDDSPGTKLAIFEVYGVRPGVKGSFVTNVDFQVQLPPNMAAMATISAQASGNIVGENATALSRLNTGLVDRVVTTKLDATSVGLATKGTATDPVNVFNDKLSIEVTTLNELYKNLNYVKDNVETLKSINRDISLYTVGDAAEKEQAPAPFFIPFNLSLEMDGLSGMRNYERFAITENVLPYSYRTSNEGGVIDFLIKGISHSISNNQWKTKIESLTVSSKRKNKQTTTPNQNASLGNTNNNTGS